MVLVAVVELVVAVVVVVVLVILVVVVVFICNSSRLVGSSWRRGGDNRSMYLK